LVARAWAKVALIIAYINGRVSGEYDGTWTEAALRSQAGRMTAKLRARYAIRAAGCWQKWYANANDTQSFLVGP